MEDKAVPDAIASSNGEASTLKKTPLSEDVVFLYHLRRSRKMSCWCMFSESPGRNKSSSFIFL